LLCLHYLHGFLTLTKKTTRANLMNDKTTIIEWKDLAHMYYKAWQLALEEAELLQLEIQVLQQLEKDNQRGEVCTQNLNMNLKRSRWS